MYKKIAVLAVSAFAVSAWALQTEIGYLDLGKDFDTPTCAVGDAKGTIFAIPYDTKTVMKLNGKLVEFKLGAGEKSLWDFRGKNTNVDTLYYSVEGTYWLHVKGTVLHSCQGEEVCEYVDMDLNVLFGDGSGEPKALSGLEGGCGV